MEESKLLKEKIIKFDGDKYLLQKKEVNCSNNHRTVKVFIRRQ